MNRRLWTRRGMWLAPIIAAMGICTFLKADDTLPPLMDVPKDMAAISSSLWYLEHYSEIAKDPESMGVIATLRARDLLKPQGAEIQVEFMNKMLYATRSRAVQRAVRMELYQLYRDTGRPDKALNELQELITEQPQ